MVLVECIKFTCDYTHLPYRSPLKFQGKCIYHPLLHHLVLHSATNVYKFHDESNQLSREKKGQYDLQLRPRLVI